MVRIKTLLDLLASSVAVIALLPVLPFVDPIVLGIAACSIAGGAWCDRHERYLLNGWSATVLAIAGVSFFILKVSWVDIAGPVVYALILLLAIRLLTPKQSRDYMQIFALGLFILAGSSLVSLDLGLGVGFLTYLVLMVFSITLGLVLLTVFVTDKRLALPYENLFKLIKVSLVMLIVSLLLMVVFFFILPRARRPMWNFLNPGGSATVGLADTVQPGAYARIAAIKKLAFRAEMDELPIEDLYWRALVLNQPEENRWVRKSPPNEQTQLSNSSRAIKLAIYPEIRSDRYLVTLDRAAALSGVRYQRSDDHVYRFRTDMNKPVRIEQLSQVGADIESRGLRHNRDFYLSLPDQISGRMRNVAAGIVESGHDQPQRIAALADFFRKQQLSYAQDDLPGGDDPIDDFLFDKKRGYCEFFASAYVTLARMAGIPARLVGGYYGGVYNPIGGYYQVSEDMAHVWVEILEGDSRWVRVDPSQWAVNASSSLNNRGAATISALEQMLDSINYRWIQSVVLFDFQSQVKVLNDTRESFRALKSGKLNLMPVIWASAILVGGVVIVFSLRRKRLSPEERILMKFRERVRKRYGPESVDEATGLAELAERLDDDHCREFARIYQGAVFRDRMLSDYERARLMELVDEI